MQFKDIMTYKDTLLYSPSLFSPLSFRILIKGFFFKKKPKRVLDVARILLITPDLNLAQAPLWLFKAC